MTNFITLESSNEKDKPKKETEFKLLINIHDGPVSAFKEPSDLVLGILRCIFGFKLFIYINL